ncbi:MAG: DHHA1 domain-containing protein, partial [Nitrospira sp.]|nr:DHHA1 domain-containing protein [Nitrospira sp.]
YEQLEQTGKVLAIIKDGNIGSSAVSGDEVEVVFDPTPFYGESGGQIGDNGIGIGPGGGIEIMDTIKPLDIIINKVRVTSGSIRAGEEWILKVSRAFRKATARSHTATHLLHSALRQVIGEHVKQAGSLVAPDRLRFDFIHFKPLSDVEIERIEDLVNEKVRENIRVVTDVMDVSEALKTGAMALFGEKYGEKVRVVQVPDFSKELCGGTHCNATGDIGVVKITAESSVASGVRRIEALTGEASLKYLTASDKTVKEITGILKVNPAEVRSRAERLVSQLKEQEREVERLKGQLNASKYNDISSDICVIEGVNVISKKAEPMTAEELRNFSESLRSKINSGIDAVGTEKDEKASIIIMVTKDLTSMFDAREIIKDVAALVDGRGGGRPDMAQAGGKRPDGLTGAMKKILEVVGEMARKGRA